MRILASLAVGTVLALATGCGADEPAEAAKISYTRSGGVAGINQTLRVDLDGAGEFERRFVEDALVDRFQLEASELERLNRLLRELDFDSLDTGRSPRCADCLLYEISYAGESLTADDVTTKPELRDAISVLDATIRNRHRPD